jgi:hypothetical protein
LTSSSHRCASMSVDIRGGGGCGPWQFAMQAGVRSDMWLLQAVKCTAPTGELLYLLPICALYHFKKGLCHCCSHHGVALAWSCKAVGHMTAGEDAVLQQTGGILASSDCLFSELCYK